MDRIWNLMIAPVMNKTENTNATIPRIFIFYIVGFRYALPNLQNAP